MREYIIPMLLLTLHGVTGQPDRVIDETVGLTNTNMTSPGYNSNLHYGPNTTWHYRFTTNYPNHTLVLTIHEFIMEAEDKNHQCLYDNLTIYNGYNESSPELAVLCDNKTAGTTYHTTGNVMFAVFQSDQNNAFKGFNIGVRSDGPTTTTSTTTTSTTSKTTPSTTSKRTSTTTTTTVATTTRSNDDGPDNNDNTSLIIIISSAVGGLLLLILLVVLIICCIKSKKRPQSAVSGDINTKRVLWSRGNTTMVQPIDFSKTTVPPGEIVQVKTNLFDIDLPTGKANLLPPISSHIP